MKKLTLQEIKDTLVGCTILGTGGGGSLESGLPIFLLLLPAAAPLV